MPKSTPREGPDFKPATLVQMAQTQLEAASMPDQKSAAQRENLYEQARQNYQRALETDPNYLPALVGLASLYERRGDPERTDEAFRRTLEAHPRAADVWYQYAEFQAKQQDWANAAGSVGMALREDGENRIYAKFLGYCLIKSGSVEQGYEWLERTMPPAEARYNAALALRHSGQQTEAIQQATLALEADPSHPKARELVSDLSRKSAGGPVPMASLPPLQPVPGMGAPPLPPHAIDPRRSAAPEGGPELILTSDYDDRSLMLAAPKRSLAPANKTSPRLPVEVRLQSIRSID